MPVEYVVFEQAEGREQDFRELHEGPIAIPQLDNPRPGGAVNRARSPLQFLAPYLSGMSEGDRGTVEDTKAELEERLVRIRSNGGRGLGLPTAADLARGSGGAITVGSNAGEYAAFTMSPPTTGAPSPD